MTGTDVAVGGDPTRRGIDSLGMLDAALGLAEQVEAAIEVGQAVEGLPSGEDVANICILGMGGSGIAGDVIAAVAQEFCPVPVVVVKGYDAPSFVADDTLVLALSFSGDTEETMQAAEEAQVAGARLVVACRGGRLAELAEEVGAPRLPIPEGIPMPRAGLGALAVPPLIVLERLGLVPGAHEWAARAVDQLRRRRDQLTAERNLATDLARHIGRTMPIVYGAGAVGAVAAQRWKAQCNENAKVPAFANTVPELCHNEVCGWGQHGDVTRQVFQLVWLRHDFEHPQEARRIELVTALVDEVVDRLHEVRAEGEGSLAQLFDLALIGDVTSIHLAYQEGLDPGPVPVLDGLKAALAQPSA